MLYSGGNLSAHRGDGEGDEQGPSLLILRLQPGLDHVDHLVDHLLLLLWLLQPHADGRGDQEEDEEVEFEHIDGWEQPECLLSSVWQAQVSIIHSQVGSMTHM